MGCASSKKIRATSPITTTKAALAAYHPPASGFAVFDINSIEEPWLKLDSALLPQPALQKPSHVPAPLLENLDDADAPPRPWDEISKALHDFKTNPPPPPPPPTPPTTEEEGLAVVPVREVAKVGAPKTELAQAEPELTRALFGGGSEGFRSVRENPFIVMDKIVRGEEGKEGILERMAMMRRDPLKGFAEKCPPGGAGAVVLYTTSLGGVRKTFEECNRARTVLEVHRVVFDERDVSLHGGYLNELRELMGESAAVPQLFIHGRYIGGVDEVVELNETGRLVRILSWAKVERGVGWQGCEGCGGARFVPCLECGGSCKVVVGEDRERCSKCNENGLAPCPLCR